MNRQCRRTLQYGGSAPATPGFNAFGPEWICNGTAFAAPAIPAAGSALWVAVGMGIATHPPRRSVRAELPHTAPPLDTSVEANIGIRMKSAGTRNPSLEDRPQMVPIRLSPLT